MPVSSYTAARGPAPGLTEKRFGGTFARRDRARPRCLLNRPGSDMTGPRPSGDGPAGPRADAIGALRPLRFDQVHMDPAGLLGGWQNRNASATLPHCIEQLDAGGALD